MTLYNVFYHIKTNTAAFFISGLITAVKMLENLRQFLHRSPLRVIFPLQNYAVCAYTTFFPYSVLLLSAVLLFPDLDIDSNRTCFHIFDAVLQEIVKDPVNLAGIHQNFRHLPALHLREILNSRSVPLIHRIL